MNLDEIKQILEMMREHELTEFELEHADFKVRLRKNAGGQWTAPMPQGNFVPAPSSNPPVAPAPPVAGEPVLTAANEDVDLTIVKSPIVGTFYRSSEPGAKPFIDIGEQVRKGQVICIIEAMKLFNEIEAEVSGKIVKVLVDDASPVEYDQPLFLVDPS